MRLRVTHIVRYELENAGSGALDGVAIEPAPGPVSEFGGRRFFVPGFLPCGSCAVCLRGLVAACNAGREVLAGATPDPSTDLDLPARYLTPLDDPPGLDPLPSHLAVRAGLVALGIQAAALANLTPGDVAVWLGGGLVSEVGVRVTSAKGARSFRVGETTSDPTARIAECGDAAGVVRQLEQGSEADPPGAGSAHQRSIRRLFLTRTDPATLLEAATLAEAGSVLISIGRGPARLGGELSLPAEARLTRVGGYHPDLVPEALALLRRAEVVLPPGLLDRTPG